MRDIQSILAATDFSVDGRQAAERAAVLGRQLALSEGMLVHVLEKSLLESVAAVLRQTGDVSEKIEPSAARALSDLSREIEKEAGFRLEPQVFIGHPLDAILEAARDADLIAIGAQGRHRLRAFTLGMTAERLIRRTVKPVLVVKQKPAGPYRRVFVAVDFSPAAEKALLFARAVAPEAQFHLAHVFEAAFEGLMFYAGVEEDAINEYRMKAGDEAHALMTRFIETAAPGLNNVFRHIEHGYPPAELPKRAAALRADLVVVGKRGKSSVEEFFMGSVTHHLLTQCDCDVLVVQ